MTNIKNNTNNTNNTKKIIYINGLPGSGKLTIANMLAQKINAKVIDNHKINNLVFDIKKFNDDVPGFIWDYFSTVKCGLYDVLEQIEQETDYIFTGCITKLNSNSYAGIKNLAEKLNAEFILITLDCDLEDVFKRIDTPERRAKQKLTDVDVYKKIAQGKFILTPEEQNSIIIDNREQTEEQTLQAVLNYVENI